MIYSYYIKNYVQRTFRVPNIILRLMFHFPIPLLKERFTFQFLPFFKLSKLYLFSK